MQFFKSVKWKGLSTWFDEYLSFASDTNFEFFVILEVKQKICWKNGQAMNWKIGIAGARGRREAKVTKMVALMIVAFLIAWTPYAALAAAAQYFYVSGSHNIFILNSSNYFTVNDNLNLHGVPCGQRHEGTKLIFDQI